MKKKYLIAVSGGPDSMALLDLYKNAIAAVLHVNYQKRSSALKDQMIVENYCHKNNLKFFVRFYEPKLTYFQLTNNFQTDARHFRYEFFNKIGKAININNLLVAHHLDDFVETAYMQLQRKSQTLFLGIQELTKILDLNVFRPLLKYRKKSLVNYCIKNDIAFGVDETNEHFFYERNLVRSIIKKWTSKQFHDFLRQVKKYNQKNASLKNHLDHLFVHWQQKKHDVRFYQQLKPSWKLHLLYAYLLSLNLYINRSKLKMIDQFINNHHPNKNLRIGNNIYLSIIGNQLVIKKPLG